MKKILFCLPVVLLLAAGCSSNFPAVENQPSNTQPTQSQQTTPPPANTQVTPTPAPSSTIPNQSQSPQTGAPYPNIAAAHITQFAPNTNIVFPDYPSVSLRIKNLYKATGGSPNACSQQSQYIAYRIFDSGSSGSIECLDATMKTDDQNTGGIIADIEIVNNSSQSESGVFLMVAYEITDPVTGKLVTRYSHDWENNPALYTIKAFSSQSFQMGFKIPETINSIELLFGENVDHQVDKAYKVDFVKRTITIENGVQLPQ